MRQYDDVTAALQTILLHFTKGYTLWVSFTVSAEKVDAIGAKWAEVFGTLLPAWKRQDRKQKGLANAVAVAAPVFGMPSKRQVILMATASATTMPKGSVWAKEKWSSRLPEFSDFVIVHEPRERGDYAWTWRLQERTATGLGNHLTALVKAGDPSAVRRETTHWLRFYPMYGGVRRQLRRILQSGVKLWGKTNGHDCWPGPDPMHIPAMVGFRRSAVTNTNETSAR